MNCSTRGALHPCENGVKQYRKVCLHGRGILEQTCCFQRRYEVTFWSKKKIPTYPSSYRPMTSRWQVIRILSDKRGFSTLGRNMCFSLKRYKMGAAIGFKTRYGEHPVPPAPQSTRGSLGSPCRYHPPKYPCPCRRESGEISAQSSVQCKAIQVY